LSFYRTFALYSAFFLPSDEIRSSIDALVRRHKPGGRTTPKRVLDPACGPGLWLEHFALRGAAVAGVELDGVVAEAGHRRLAALEGCDATIVEGDMRSPPAAIRGPFDLAINLDNSIGHLGDLADMAMHLRAMHELLGPKGIYLLGLAVRETDDAIDPAVVYERGPVGIAGGGFAALKSETLGLHPSGLPEGFLCERIRHTVLTAGVEGSAPLFLAQYDLLTLPFAVLHRLLAEAGPWSILDCRDATDEALPSRRFARGCGDVLLVLRPATKATPRSIGKVGRGKRTTARRPRGSNR
jgi:SAM-dependent methyltransferase